MRISDWSSDVCSSDLTVFRTALYPAVRFFRLRTALAHLRAHHGYGNLRNVGSRLRKFGGYFDLGLNLFIRMRSRGLLLRDGFRLDGWRYVRRRPGKICIRFAQNSEALRVGKECLST